MRTANAIAWTGQMSVVHLCLKLLYVLYCYCEASLSLGKALYKLNIIIIIIILLSSHLYERILQFRALSCLCQQGTDVRTFAQRFSNAAEGLGFNHAALKDMFNSVLDEPLNWWRMRGWITFRLGSLWGSWLVPQRRRLEHLQSRSRMPPRLHWWSMERLHPQWRPSRSSLLARRLVQSLFPVQEPTEPAPVEAKEAAAPPAALDEAAAPPAALDEAAAPPVVADGAPALVAADEAAASRSQKRRRRRKKPSSTLQGLEAVPEPSAGQEAVPEPPKRLALPAPPKSLALPAPPKRLALPVPPRLPVLPAPPWLPARISGLCEPLWLNPPVPPWTC